MHHTGHEPAAAARLRARVRANAMIENSHPTCQVSLLLNVAARHASDPQRATVMPTSELARKTREIRAFAVVGANSGCANQRSVRINTQMD